MVTDNHATHVDISKLNFFPFKNRPSVFISSSKTDHHTVIGHVCDHIGWCIL